MSYEICLLFGSFAQCFTFFNLPQYILFVICYLVTFICYFLYPFIYFCAFLFSLFCVNNTTILKFYLRENFLKYKLLLLYFIYFSTLLKIAFLMGWNTRRIDFVNVFPLLYYKHCCPFLSMCFLGFWLVSAFYYNYVIVIMFLLYSLRFFSFKSTILVYSISMCDFLDFY